MIYELPKFNLDTLPTISRIWKSIKAISTVCPKSNILEKEIRITQKVSKHSLSAACLHIVHKIVLTSNAFWLRGQKCFLLMAICAQKFVFA